MNPLKKPARVLLIVFYLVILFLVRYFWVHTNEPNIQSSLSEKSDLSRFTPLDLNPEYRELLDLQATFVRNARNIKPAVVGINNLTKIDKSPYPRQDKYPKTPPLIFRLKEWLIDVFERRFMIESLGSGLIWDSSGHVVTNYHVIEDAESLLIRLPGGQEFRASLLGADPITDLAILKIFSWNYLPTAPVGRTSNLKVGEWVMAIGNPYGLEGTVTVGVISGKNGTRESAWDYLRYIQTDTSINPGNSGGPLVNLDGEIIGINTISEDLGPGLGLTLPIEKVFQVSSRLIENGKIDWGWLGISIQPLTPELAASFYLSGSETGVLINAIKMESPASTGGLKRGDIIIQYDHHPVSGFRALQDQVANTPIGQKVPIKVIRNGTSKTIFVEIGKRDSKHFLSNQDSSRLI